MVPSYDAARSIAQVDALLHPRNIVIAGATDRPGNWAQRIWRNVVRHGYPGPVFPFSPNRDTVWGQRCYRHFSDLPEAPDHLVVVSPAASVPALLSDAAAAGARSATIITAGFSESTDAAAQAADVALREVIQRTGLAVSGPNCVGNISAAARVMTNIEDRFGLVAPGPVGVVGQSGGLVMAIKRTLEERGLDASFMVTSGNEAGLTTADYIAYFASRPEIKVIACYLEAIRDRHSFFAACRTAREAGKPVVVVKLGTSKAGQAAALAHTGALAGAVASFDAVAADAGIIRVRNVDEMVSLVELFAHSKVPAGRNVGVVTTSGGKRGLAIDAAEAAGAVLPELAPQTRAALDEMLGAGTIVGNPLDAGFAANASLDTYLQCVRTMLADPGIDLLVLEGELPRGAGTERREAYLKGAHDIAAASAKPVIYTSVASYGLTEYGRAFRKTLPNIAFLQGIDATLAAVVRRLAYMAQLGRRPSVPGQSSGQARAILADITGTTRSAVLDEMQSKLLLRAYGIETTQDAVAQSADDAAAIADRICYPVVAKILSVDVPHKSDVGGVVLGIRDAASVRVAYDSIVARVRALPSRPSIAGVLICEQAPSELELVLGAFVDPEVGPVVMLGSGGVDVELLSDVAFAAAPLTGEQAAALIGSTKAGIRVQGYRGRAPLNRAAVVQALVGLSHLIADGEQAIVSIDINPFLLSQTRGLAADGLVVLRRTAPSV